MSELLKIAKNAAAAGGEIIRHYFENGVEMREKGKVDFVSDADIEAEAAIASVIRLAFPEHSIMGEETHEADASADQLWIVDPLDGTTNFAHGIPHIGVSIAYYENGVPTIGVVLNPITNDWYIAQKGKGATMNDQPAQVANHKQLDESLVAVGFYYDRGAMMQATLKAIDELFQNNIHGIRRFGTAALDLCLVGTGQFGAFFEYQLSPWDFAAGRLFVAEAGGQVTTCTGEELPVAKSTVLATNGVLHENVLQIVRKHCP